METTCAGKQLSVPLSGTRQADFVRTRKRNLHGVTCGVALHLVLLMRGGEARDTVYDLKEKVETTISTVFFYSFEGSSAADQVSRQYSACIGTTDTRPE